MDKTLATSVTTQYTIGVSVSDVSWFCSASPRNADNSSSYNYNYLLLRLLLPPSPPLLPVVLRVLDLHSKGRGLDSQLMHCQAATLGKLFTPMCLCHQADATNAFSRPMTINVTLFTDSYTKTAINFSLTVLIIFIVQLRFDNS